MQAKSVFKKMKGNFTAKLDGVVSRYASKQSCIKQMGADAVAKFGVDAERAHTQYIEIKPFLLYDAR